MSKNIAVLEGDGIGPEIIGPAVDIMRQLGDFDFTYHAVGGCAIDATGEALPPETLDACLQSDAVLLGAVGGPQWNTTDRSQPRPEQALLGLRKELALYANLRPARILPALYDVSPLRQERVEGTDLLIVRELTGGIYFGEKTRVGDTARDVCEYTKGEVERIAHVAFRLARTSVTSVDKENVLETSKLWREVVTEVAGQYRNPDKPIQLKHMLADAAFAELIGAPSQFDVILADNLFGDLLSDEAAKILGSVGMLASVSLGDGSTFIIEPGHGSAPDIAGQNKANPSGTFYSVALGLRHGFDMPEEAQALEDAVEETIEAGIRTKDIGGSATTQEFSQAVIGRI